MSETRWYNFSGKRQLPFALPGQPQTPSRREKIIRWVVLVAFAICFVVGLLDLISRLDSYLGQGDVSSISMAAGPGFASLQENPLQDPPPDTSALPAESSASIIPARLIIPSIGVNASVEQVGLNSAGQVKTPSSFKTVAWYEDGPQPGQAGNAVIDGHVDNALTAAGVFQHLTQIQIGDTVEVTSAAGTTLLFTVYNIQEYPVDSAPTAQIFATTGGSGLALITCDGVWDASKKEFDQRLVVFAKLAS